MGKSTGRVKKLLLQYRDVIAELRRLGVIRSGRVVCDYGEYLVCRRLGLEQVGSAVNKGYDAVDPNGLKYEIKARKATAWSRPSLFAITEKQLKSCDLVIVVEFDNDWRIVKLLKIPVSDLEPNKYGRVHLSKALVAQYSILD